MFTGIDRQISTKNLFISCSFCFCSQTPTTATHDEDDDVDTWIFVTPRNVTGVCVCVCVWRRKARLTADCHPIPASTTTCLLHWRSSPDGMKSHSWSLVSVALLTQNSFRWHHQSGDATGVVMTRRYVLKSGRPSYTHKLYTNTASVYFMRIKYKKWYT